MLCTEEVRFRTALLQKSTITFGVPQRAVLPTVNIYTADIHVHHPVPWMIGWGNGKSVLPLIKARNST